MDELRAIDLTVSEQVAPTAAEAGVEAGGGTWKMDFGRPVERAFAWLTYFNLLYNKDHHVRRLEVGANVTKIEGSVVYGNWWGNMHDDSGNWAGAKVTILCHVYYK